MKVTVLQFPGTNCEYDTKYAFEKLGAQVQIVWHQESVLPESDLVVVPGGFSYGDYLRSGAIAKFAPIMEDVKVYANKGGMVLGICNGFQILLEAGLLPGAMKRNSNLHFISKHSYLKVFNNENKFLEMLETNEVVNIPVAHHDGNYYADEQTIKDMYKNGQVLLKYCNEFGEAQSLNGSVEHIAGICNKTKNVFGLMPHPERAMETLLGSDDGVKMLQGFFN